MATKEMPNVTLLETTPLPMQLVFWRPRRDLAGRTRDRVQHFNPLFATLHNTEPEQVLAIDLLHTVYYGPMMRLIAAILWRVVLSNPWGIVGNLEHVLEQAARRLEAHMLNWFDSHHVPRNRRLGTLTLSMLGNRMGHGINDGKPHPGCPLKLKAAETGHTLPWALGLLEERGNWVDGREHLLIAGGNESLVGHYTRKC